MKIRIISSIIMAIVLLPILIIGGSLFTFCLSLILGLSLGEMYLVKFKRLTVPLLFFIISLILFFNLSVKINMVLLYIILFNICTLLFSDRQAFNLEEKNSEGYVFNIGITLYIYLGLFFMNEMRVDNIASDNFTAILYFLVPIFCAILSDTFAYFSGMFFGKRKLFFYISPKKTIEGAIGGTLVGTLGTALLCYLFLQDSIEGTTFLDFILLSFCLSILGQIGDLFASKIKRDFGVKDFSNLIPGHGGILDRIDSYLIVYITFGLFYIL